MVCVCVCVCIYIYIYIYIYICFSQPNVFDKVLTSCIMVVLFTLAFLPSAICHLYCALISTIVYKLYLLDTCHNSGILDFHHHGTRHNILGHEC